MARSHTAAPGRVAQFRLPDLGEGLTEAEILRWLVSPGDTVTLNQPILEVETAKAVVELPSPYAGRVARLHHPAGEVVDVGAVILSVDTEPAAGPLPADPAADADADADADAAADPATGVAANLAAGAAANPVESAVARNASAVGSDVELRADVLPAVEAGKIGGEAPGGRTAVLVGYGPKSGAATRRPRAAAPPPALPEPAVPVAPPPATAARVSAAAVGQAAARTTGGVSILAKPPVRRLAKQLGVDLGTLVGTGPNGTVTRSDVEAAARPAGPSPADAMTRPVPGALAPPAQLGRETRVPVRGVRKHTAAAMVGSAFSAPHVTEFLTLDMTPSMDLLARLKMMPEFQDVRLSPLLLVARALLLALRRHPDVNSTWDNAAQEIVVKHYVNLGIAAATPRGLLVPNIKDAQLLSLVELARALSGLAEAARGGRTSVTDMAQGTITITNVGMFGVDSGTPILNPGESAILCFGAVRPMPWVHEGEVAVRQVTQLSLSFDHRTIDGQLGSVFLSDLGRVLADPTVALAWT